MGAKEKPHCLNCGTPSGAHIYCEFFSMYDDFDQETDACCYWTERKHYPTIQKGIIMCTPLDNKDDTAAYIKKFSIVSIDFIITEHEKQIMELQEMKRRIYRYFSECTCGDFFLKEKMHMMKCPCFKG